MKNLHTRLSAQCRLSSPLGGLVMARTPAGLAGLWFDGQRHHPGELHAPIDEQDSLMRQAAEELAAFWRGEPVAFGVPLDLQGTPFQRAVWQALLEVPLGKTCSYRDLAARLGSTSATRAVGAAVGRNPVSVIVPCHRVLGSNGGLTGYAGGLERKAALLQLERVLAL